MRRSARLRGLAPEFDGLQDVKRTRRSKVPDESPEPPLEQLLRPYRRTWAESFFAYWGYFSEKEIARRRSLRLQGLDPEFEGLTWGHRPRRRRTRKTKNQRGFLSYFMGRQSSDEEVFFEYQDQTENGRLQRFLDFVLNKIGFLHFEDIEEPNDVIGIVQLFVNLIFILYARWRCKIVCLQAKLATLAI